jgi:hypothetical protein
VQPPGVILLSSGGMLAKTGGLVDAFRQVFGEVPDVPAASSVPARMPLTWT